MKIITRIAEKHIEFTYLESKRVYEKNLPIKEAAKNIHTNCGIKINSSSDYGYYYRYLMTGSSSCRSLSSFTQEYYLEHILNSCKRQEEKQKILTRFKKLIEKFEGEKVGSRKSMNAIYEKYSKLI